MQDGFEHKVTMQSKIQVLNMTRAGIPPVLQARTLDICEATLKKHYKHELDTALHEAVSDLASVLYAKALGGCDKSLALYLKTQGARFGFVEKQVVENVDSEETQQLRAQIAEYEAKQTQEY